MTKTLPMTDFITFLISFGIGYFILVYFPKFSDKNWVQRRLYSLRDKSLLDWHNDREENDPAWVEQVLSRVLIFFRNLNALEVTQWKQLLSLAGWRTKRSFAIFLAAKLLGAAGLLLGALILSMVGRLFMVEPLITFALLALAGIVGFRLPNLIVEIIGKRRQTKINAGVADMLDMMVICTDAGLGLDATLEKVAREMVNINKPMAEVLNLLIIELMFTSDRRQALLNLYNRTEVKALHTLATTFIQSERYGTTLSQALRTIASESRQQRMLEAEAKAARLPATLTIPLIVLILPCLFIVILGPVIIAL